MKKNVFSRTIAVLASMTVLGAASMLTASAKGVQVATVTVAPGTTSVELPVNMVDVASQGATLKFSSDKAEITDIACDGALASEGTVADGITAVYASGTVYKTDKAFETLVVTIAADAEPGEYPVYVSVVNLDDNGTDIAASADGIAGAVVIEAPPTEPETTEATTEATTAAPTTTAKPGAAPKTGSAGVAVAVAGLVTAGATAVVLKKKH